MVLKIEYCISYGPLELSYGQVLTCDDFLGQKAEYRSEDTSKETFEVADATRMPFWAEGREFPCGSTP